MPEINRQISFETLIDNSLMQLCGDEPFDHIENKRLVTLINDYEDGEWRYQKFKNFVWDNIPDTSLSFIERESLIDQSYTRLVEAAKNLRLTDSDLDPSKGSELAEAVLYGVMRHKFNALPVVPKIFYKQNQNDPVKGADSVHIILNDDNDIKLCLGEAKFYSSIDNARLPQIIRSVGESLSSDKIRKENSLITNLSDLDEIIDDAEKVEEIKNLLSQDVSIDDIKPKLLIPILIIHECNITQAHSEMSSQYREKIKKYHCERAGTYFRKQVKKLSEIHKYEEIHFNLVLLPIPSKDRITQEFIETAEFYKAGV